jgi:hypothetical protein
MTANVDDAFTHGAEPMTPTPGEDQFPLVWHWRGHEGVRQRSCVQRKGQRCRRLFQGRNGNVLVAFEDGFRTVAPRHAVRRVRKEGEADG